MAGPSPPPVEVVVNGGAAEHPDKAPAREDAFGSTRAVGKVLFNEYLFPFEAVSLVLLVAVVGGIAVARPHQARTERSSVSWSHERHLLQADRQPLPHPGAVLFAIGTVGVLMRRNALIVMMSIELMMNAANLTVLAFARYHGGTAGLEGQSLAFIVIAVAAAEAAVGLAIVVAVFRTRRHADIDRLNLLKN
jgi:NADH-quinone oxidoreductase subunit K